MEAAIAPADIMKELIEGLHEICAKSKSVKVIVGGAALYAGFAKEMGYAARLLSFGGEDEVEKRVIDVIRNVSPGGHTLASNSRQTRPFIRS